MNDAGLYKTLRIKTIRDEAPSFKVFELEAAPEIHYKAGQYLTLVRFQNGTEIRRSYSITSAPVLHEPLSIGVKRVPNGIFSRYLIDDAKPGDELLTTGSGGFFVLPDEIRNYQQLFFLAAGSGITPIFSLLKTALYAFPHLSVVLVYSNASMNKTAFRMPLHELEQAFSGRLHIEWLFSNVADLSRARLHRDLLLQLLYQSGVPDREKILFYTCGPESYMRMCIYTLQEHGIHADQLKKELFNTTVASKRDAVPPDTQRHIAHIRFAHQSYQVDVSYPDSILRAAKKQGISLPYSCEAGRCGNCVAKCERGKVWHSYNEVLTEKELQQGLVLTCVGHPVGGDIELTI